MIRKLTHHWLIISLVALLVTAGAAVSQGTAGNGILLVSGLLNALGLMPDGCTGCTR